MLEAKRRKSHGIHYTPKELARFLAEAALEHTKLSTPAKILDPACGDGALLVAVAEALSAKIGSGVTLVGCDADDAALIEADAALRGQASPFELRHEDFLSLELGNSSRSTLFADTTTQREQFDLVIANPPYVRTQVLGAIRAQALAQQFDLTGRVDLYHAFVKAMAAWLRPGGTLALLTSNRFLSIQSGAAMRRLLRMEFDLKAIYDLGDTKLFSAAVLPSIVIATKAIPSMTAPVFTRIYESRGEEHDGEMFASVLDIVRRGQTCRARTSQGYYALESGQLATARDPGAPFVLTNDSTGSWLAGVRQAQELRFDDVVQIRVGIKTTADAVFIRTDWESLPEQLRPESAVLQPLVTHFDEATWRFRSEGSAGYRVLYTHEVVNGKRRTIDMERFPRARAYLESHRPRLEGRRYVIDAGRKWYEIWVPQDPAAWQRPKIVFPDIAEYPRFFLDTSGSIVNGDCYWMSLRPGVNKRWLMVMLAVANSSFIVRYYDAVFHNKLYAGRRRFITQYVKDFPLPAMNSPLTQELIATVEQLADIRSNDNQGEVEQTIDRLVWRAFGLCKEV